MNVQRLGREPGKNHKPATDTYLVDGVLVEANAHRGFACYVHGASCKHVEAVEKAIRVGQVPQLEEWNRAEHWG